MVLGSVHILPLISSILTLPWISHANDWHPRDEVNRGPDFNGASVAQVLADQSGTLMHFDHYILIEMEVNLLQMTDYDWDQLAEYLRISYYSSSSQGCGKDEAVRIDNVIMNPHYVPFASGIANFTDYIMDEFISVRIPVLLEMSCVDCDPDLVVLLEGLPDLPGADRRRLKSLGSSSRKDRQELEQQQQQQGEDEHNSRRLIGFPFSGRENNKFVCEPGDNFDVTLDFFTKVIDNPDGPNIDPVNDIFYVADIPTKLENCWENHTLQEFEYTMYFNAQAAPRFIIGSSILAFYADLFTRVYNEVNARDWRRCDSEGRVATWAELSLPEGSWTGIEVVTWSITFYGYCVNCVPEGCLFENDPAEGWPAVIEELPDRPVLRPSRSSARNNDDNNNDRADRPYRNGRTSESIPTTRRDDDNTRMLFDDGNNFDYDFSSASHRRLSHETLGECLCNEYAEKKERPSFQEFSDKLSEAFLFITVPPYMGRILEVWEENPGICNTCCGWPDDQIVTFTDRNSLFDGSDAVFVAGGSDTSPDFPLGKVACWNVSGVENFQGIWGGFNVFPLDVDLSCWDVSNGRIFTDTFGSSNITNVGDIGKWDMSNAETMSGMFHSTIGFNADISDWEFPRATDLSFMFALSEDFNSDISDWDVSRIESFSQMFVGAKAFDQSLADWDPSSGTDFIEMFAQSTYNQPLGNWSFANGTSLAGMFFEADFNNEISGWDVSRVVDMAQMFELDFNFNQPLTGWNPSSCTNFLATFATTAFNQPVDHFDVSNGVTFEAMFYNAIAFDQPLDSWTPVSGENFYIMFALAQNFRQNLCHWTTIITQDNIDNGGVNALSQMFFGTNCSEVGPVLAVDTGPYCFNCVG